MKTVDEYFKPGMPSKTVNLPYEFKETRELVELVEDAANLIQMKGTAAFDEFRMIGSRWRAEDRYVFVLDLEGNMLVHPDASLMGRNLIDLKDVNGKFIIRGLLAAATALPEHSEGWYHYQWPEPDGLLPRWKSSFVKYLRTPAGDQYVAGCGIYNDRMERSFVVDLVMHAVAEIEEHGKAAFKRFHDPTAPYLIKDAYIYITDLNGVEIVNPAFPNLEGQKLLDKTDAAGNYVYREMIHLIQSKGDGWIDYLWPKPGESVPSLKSAYVHAVNVGGETLIVGCGMYPAAAPVHLKAKQKLSASELTALVRDAAALLEKEGEKAYPAFRRKGSKWFHDEAYLFVFSLDGTRVFHAAEPESEGRNDLALKDAMGRPIVRLIMEAAATPFGKGWVHYMYPEPGELYPAWKSSLVKRVTYPSGKQYIVGSGIYRMQMDKTFVEDVVNRAAALIANRGRESFNVLRDKTGPFVFMDTYVFVLSPDGTELVNAGMPNLEGKNLLHVKDLQGKTVVRDEVEAALSEGSAWLEFYWYLPGDNTPALKQTFVRKVQFIDEIFIVGSGLYGGEGPVNRHAAGKIIWDALDTEQMNERLFRQAIFGENATLARFTVKAGGKAARHYHENEEYLHVLSGRIDIHFDDHREMIKSGEGLLIPPNVPHEMAATEDTVFLDFFAPAREDWLKGDDQYLRR